MPPSAIAGVKSKNRQSKNKKTFVVVMAKIFFNAAPPYIAAHRAQFPCISPNMKYQDVSVLSVEMPDHRLTPKIGSWRKYIHAAQNRTENALLGYLRRSSGIVPDADSLRSLENYALHALIV
jgi:hypothetical protein